MAFAFIQVLVMTVVAIALGIYLLRIDQQTFDVQDLYVLQRLVFHTEK